MSGNNKSELKRGINGRPYLELCHPSGAQLDVYLHGAQAISWRAGGGKQLLFMSKKSFFKPDYPIRGGIPVVFPQFGAGPLPKHGFARIRDWTFLGVRSDRNGDIEAKLELKENQQTLKLWPHKFRLEIGFQLKAAELEVSFSVQNTGRLEFEFQNGLHTYFSVADISRISVQGLVGARFFDFLGPGTEETEMRERILFDRETDRVYPSAPKTAVLEDKGNRRKIAIYKNGMKDIVLWNPWVEKSKRMEDFGDEEYKNMVCVETGNLREMIRLAPGASPRQMVTRYRLLT
ncbi:MAG: D-hexose-6-phosphate mutarotase [Kiritimatiellia bacterium]|nr:D-hexose-6-phosphate mutarotase [Kiritimatiellia bacterium]